MDPSVSCFIVCEERGFDFLPGSFHKRTLALQSPDKHQGEVMILLYSSLLKGEEAKITMTLGEYLLKDHIQLQEKSTSA